MKDAMDQDDVAFHFVEDQIVVDDKNSIAKRRELGIVRDTTDEGVGFQRFQTGLDAIERFSRCPCILCGQVGHEIRQILLSDREQADGVFT